MSLLVVDLVVEEKQNKNKNQNKNQNKSQEVGSHIQTTTLPTYHPFVDVDAARPRHH